MRILRATFFLTLILALVYFSIGDFKINIVVVLVAIILLAGIFIGIISWLVGNSGKNR